jgi:CBS domain-containing protein
MDLDFTVTSKKEFLSMKLSQFNPKNIESVLPKTSLEDVISTLHTKNIGAVLVMEGAKLKGVATERDIINKLADPASDISKLTVTDVMTTEPKTLTTSNTFEDAMKLMNEGGFRHVPITDEQGVVVSIFSIKEALDFILMHL